MNDGVRRRPRRFGLRPQLLLLLFALNIVAAIAYSTMLYSIDRREIVAGIDYKLETAVNATHELIPVGYHRRVHGPGSISPAEFDRVQDKLSRFATASDIIYVYSYMRFNGRIHTVATSATASEIKAGKQTRFFTRYDTAPAKLYQSFADGQIRFDEYEDSFGSFRSIYMPVRSPDGRIHVLGADIDLASLDERLMEALLTSILVGVGMFVLSMLVGTLLVNRIVGPLVRLTSYTRSIEERSFQSNEQELAAMQKISGSRGDEVGSLAEAMSGMISRLQRYLIEMQVATAARERVEGELSAARDIQIGMVPRQFPAFPERQDIDIHALLEPAKEVGGDLYNYAMIDEHRLFFVIGDVSGKGVPAALFMAMTSTLFKAASMTAKDTAALMARVNAELSRDNVANLFVTAFCGIIDLRDGSIEYSDAGHEAPFLLRADGRVSRLPKPEGMALGIFDDADFASATVRLAPGDALIMFTDGVSEATTANEELFAVERIEAALAGLAKTPSAKGIATDLAERVNIFVGDAPQFDDIAILVVRYRG
ncbi:PP2C family protein-serine/threonine phosphatase [Sphingomonas sp. SRS2]|uniref:PP2C family protein-serine/threonine phosphatase n=1 Tax=Sphingomonas sp. SRS2 TaxID=133190 RepID=UPI0006184208|nr:SpoIIE family protein phosphatase [Sphingomonas sp. SRS2]KKC26579.1 stage II sporulation protein E [Sphingomonas sp. SRS2]